MESLGVMNLEGFGIDLDHPGLGPAERGLCSGCFERKTGNLNRIEEHRAELPCCLTLLPREI